MGPTTRRMNAPGLDSLYMLVFAVFGLGVGIERLSDNSFFLHLRTGWSILDAGVPHVDPYSYVASGTSWVAQSWLAEVIYGGLDRIAGPLAIRGLMAIIAALVFALVFGLALRITGERLRAALLCVAALAPLFVLWSERPLAFGLLLFVAVIWVVEVPESWVGRHELVVLVGVFWCWANVHGSFALGFAYLACILTDRFHHIFIREGMWPELEEHFALDRSENEPCVDNGKFHFTAFSSYMPVLKISRLAIDLKTLAITEEPLIEAAWPPAMVGSL